MERVARALQLRAHAVFPTSPSRRGMDARLTDVGYYSGGEPAGD